MGLQLNIFLVQNFLLIIGAAGSCMLQLLTFPLFGYAFCKKGYSSHCRVLSFLGFFPHCGPKELKSFNINRAYLSFIDS